LKFHFKSDVYENENEEANLISFFIMWWHMIIMPMF
jgi:hypothetical protein